MTSSSRNLARSGPSCSAIAVDPATSAISTVTTRRSPASGAMPVVCPMGSPRWESGPGCILRAVPSEQVAALAKVPLFAGIGERELTRLANQLTERSFPEGATITREGQTGVGFFLILEGTALV